MGLIQSVIEKRSIPTVSITMLPEITRKVRCPRALFVDTPLGYPLGEPNDPSVQTAIILAALQLLRDAPRGQIVDYA